ncbi:MAG TPA: PIG-L deacetylase family protein [Pirellulales bacterium]|nr:PIG-L deacetylase family protein [Pirellulales bacterium]
MLKRIKRLLPLHPRALWHSLTTYRRFLGTIKPELLRGTEDERLAWHRSLTRSCEVARLQAPIGRRLVVLAPHPDDESIGAGGLLLAHEGRCEIHIVNLFAGKGGGQLSPGPACAQSCSQEELIAARRKELIAAGAMIGAASIHYLDLPAGQASLTTESADALGRVVEQLRPDVVLLPWYLDNHGDHRATNALFAWSCRDIDCIVLGYEIWTLCPPNSVLDITDWLDKKLALVALYQTQLNTVDYLNFVRGAAMTRGFLHSVRAKRTGAAEAFLAMPNRDYCDVVTSLYGDRGRPNPFALPLF